MSANVAATPISSVSTTEALAFLLLAVCWDQHQEIDRLAEGSPPASHGSSVSQPRVGCLTNTCETIDAQLLRRVRKPRRREPRRSQERDSLDPGGLALELSRSWHASAGGRCWELRVTCGWRNRAGQSRTTTPFWRPLLLQTPPGKHSFVPTSILRRNRVGRFCRRRGCSGRWSV